MNPRVDGEFRVEDTASDAKLLEEELQAVTPINVANKDDALSLDQLELEDDVRKQKLFVLAASELLAQPLTVAWVLTL